MIQSFGAQKEGYLESLTRVLKIGIWFFVGIKNRAPGIKDAALALPPHSFREHCFLCAAEITEEFIAKQKQARLCDLNIL